MTFFSYHKRLGFFCVICDKSFWLECDEDWQAHTISPSSIESRILLKFFIGFRRLYNNIHFTFLEYLPYFFLICFPLHFFAGCSQVRMSLLMLMLYMVCILRWRCIYTTIKNKPKRSNSVQCFRKAIWRRYTTRVLAWIATLPSVI